MRFSIQKRIQYKYCIKVNTVRAIVYNENNNNKEKSACKFPLNNSSGLHISFVTIIIYLLFVSFKNQIVRDVNICIFSPILYLYCTFWLGHKENQNKKKIIWQQQQLAPNTFVCAHHGCMLFKKIYIYKIVLTAIKPTAATQIILFICRAIKKTRSKTAKVDQLNKTILLPYCKMLNTRVHMLHYTTLIFARFFSSFNNK